MTQTLVRGEHKTTLKISGNVLYVIRGEVDPDTLKPINLDDFRFALGSASLQDPQSFGEAIVIERRPFISWIANGKLATKEEPKMTSPFLMGIDDKQILGALIHCQPEPPSALHELFLELSQRYPMGFALLGCAQLLQCHSTYLKKAPVHKENIIEMHKEYWAPDKVDRNQPVCIFGVVIPEPARQKFPEEILQKGFYRNPAEAARSGFDAHCHAALLSEGPEKMPHNMNEFFKSLKDLPVTGVRHLLLQSVLQEATFAIFPLNDIVLV